MTQLILFNKEGWYITKDNKFIGIGRTSIIIPAWQTNINPELDTIILSYED